MLVFFFIYLFLIIALNIFQLQRRHEQMKKSLELQIKELEEKRKALEAEKTAWEQTNGITIEELRRRSLERE